MGQIDFAVCGSAANTSGSLIRERRPKGEPPLDASRGCHWGRKQTLDVVLGPLRRPHSRKGLDHSLPFRLQIVGNVQDFKGNSKTSKRISRGNCCRPCSQNEVGYSLRFHRLRTIRTSNSTRARDDDGWMRKSLTQQKK